MRRFELLDKDSIGVSFPYNEKIIEQIKKLPGAKMESQGKTLGVLLKPIARCRQDIAG